MRQLRHWLWPYHEPQGEQPVARGKESGTVIVLEHARDLVERQSSSYDALDAKAATIIGAIFVVLGLVLPNVRLTTIDQRIALVLFLVPVGYGLIVAFKAYSVTKLKIGVSASTITSAMSRSEETARAAVAVHLLRKYVENHPAIERKAAFVLRGLVALGLAVPPLVALSVSGALK